MGILHYFFDNLTAASFAEGGDHDTARTLAATMPTLSQRLAKKARITGVDRTMAAIAFAEAGEAATAADLLASPNGAAASVRVRDRRMDVLFERQGKIAEAVTFAEHDVADHARRIVLEQDLCRKKILLVGQGDEVSSVTGDYAVMLASKMDCDLVALHVTTSTAHSTSSEKQAYRDAFRESATQKAQGLVSQAAAKGVACSQLVEFGEPDEVIRKICATLGDVVFVLTESETAQAAEGAVPVFRLAYTTAGRPEAG